MNTRSLIERARAAAWRPKHELDALGVAPLDDAERAALRDLLRFLERFALCAAHVGAASEAERERLREVVEATGSAPKQGRDFDSQAHHTARSLCASLKKPEGDSALVRDLRSRGYRL